ncbi:hypothetical protein [Paraclostridium bifermentans]|uniref:hypothetical protein n=1 Tax=Paraclostridium bifermentans TaxID=1490 RepID=UPI0018AA377E|nr:hypothetical protein [Paraclostridium bifermentans]
MSINVSKEFINEKKDEIIKGVLTLQDKYIEDNKLFDKINFLLETYTKRSSWPFSVDEFLDTMEEILGDDYIKFITFYRGSIEHEEIRNDLNLDKKFESELIFFSDIIGNVVMPAIGAKNRCFKLDSVHTSDVFNGILVVNFTRSDNESFKFEVDIDIAKGIKSFMEAIIKDFEEETAGE